MQQAQPRVAKSIILIELVSLFIVLSLMCNATGSTEGCKSIILIGLISLSVVLSLRCNAPGSTEGCKINNINGAYQPVCSTKFNV